MDFRQIMYFIKVSECDSISKAAEELFISQQALSQSVKSLEKELDCRLLYRTSKGIKLTEDGKYLKGKFKYICSDFEKARKESFNHFIPNSGKLDFCAAPGIFRTLSPDIIMEFEKEYPYIRVNQLETPDLDCEDYIRMDDRNFGISTKPWNPQGMYYLPLHRENILAIMNKSNPLAEKECLDMADLRNEKFLFFNNRYNIYYRTLSRCHNAGFDPNIIYKSTDVSQLVKLASDNKGVLLCVHHVYAEANHGQLICVPISDEEMYWEIGVICKEYYKLEKQSKTFIEYIYNKTVVKK